MGVNCVIYVRVLLGFYVLSFCLDGVFGDVLFEEIGCVYSVVVIQNVELINCFSDN